jgi:hypothetical protein
VTELRKEIIIEVEKTKKKERETIVVAIYFCDKADDKAGHTRVEVNVKAQPGAKKIEELLRSVKKIISADFSSFKFCLISCEIFFR